MRQWLLRLPCVCGLLLSLAACPDGQAPAPGLDAAAPPGADAGPPANPDAGAPANPDAATVPDPDASTEPVPDAATTAEPDAALVNDPDAATAGAPDAAAPPGPDAATSAGPDAETAPPPDGGSPVADAGCTPESDTELCSAASTAGKTCGAITATDRCGQDRSVDCGTTACAPGTTCLSNRCVPDNDDCAQAQVLDTSGLDPAGNGTLTVTGDTSLASSSGQSLKCSVGAGPDLVYSLTTDPADGLKDLQVTLSFGAASARPVVYLRKGDCASPGASDEWSCASSATTSSATLNARAVPGGTYYVWADSLPSAGGAFTLTLVLSDALALPGNDACGAAGSLATSIDLTGDTGAVTGDTRPASDDYAGGCASVSAPQNGGDLVYSFTVPSGSNRSVSVEVAPDASTPGFAPAVYLWDACDPASVGRELACARAAAGGKATAMAYSLPPGTYYVVVDGQNGTAGGFTLTLRLGTAVPEDCNSALPVPLDASGHGVVTGTTEGAVNDTKGSCDYASGGDYVFSVDTRGLGTTNLAAKLTFQENVTLGDLFLWSACVPGVPGPELACVHKNPATLTRRDLPAGVYYLWVDESSVGAEGPFTLEVDVAPVASPPGNDLCAAAVQGGPFDITASLATGAPVSGDTSSAAGDYSQSCQIGSGADVVYYFEIATDSSLEIGVTPDGSSSYVPYLYVQKACGGTGSANQVSNCVRSPGGGLGTGVTLPSLAPGAYYLIVDGDNGTWGRFTLTAKTGPVLPPPTGDYCGGPIPDLGDLSLGGQTVSGYTVGAGDDVGTACSGTLDDSPDVFYKFTSSVPGKYLQAKVTATTPGYRPVLFASYSCSFSNSTPCSTAPLGAATTTFTFTNVSVGYTNYVGVDGTGTTSGAYVLELSLVDPPANDACAGAEVLAPGVPVLADTCAAAPNYSNTSLCTTMTAQGRDLVYAYTPAAAGPFSVTLAPSASWNTSLWVSTVCGDGSKCVGGRTEFYGLPSALNLSGKAATTYYIHVDATDTAGPSACGPFSLVVR